jgi:hypothetical protein
MLATETPSTSVLSFRPAVWCGIPMPPPLTCIAVVVVLSQPKHVTIQGVALRVDRRLAPATRLHTPADRDRSRDRNTPITRQPVSTVHAWHINSCAIDRRQMHWCRCAG